MNGYTPLQPLDVNAIAQEISREGTKWHEISRVIAKRIVDKFGSPDLATRVAHLESINATLLSDLRTARKERDAAHEGWDMNRALRHHAEAERDDIIAICRGNQLTDAALASMRKYVEKKLRIERELAEARAIVKAAYLEGADRRNYIGSDMDTDDELWRASDARKGLEEL